MNIAATVKFVKSVDPTTENIFAANRFHGCLAC